MATRNPQVQTRSQQQRDWGNYASLDECPNAALYAGATNYLDPLEEGDTVYVVGSGRAHCTNPGTPGALDATWALTGVEPSIQRVEIDFGSIPTTSASFLVVDINATPASRVVTWESAETATGRVGVDQEWDQLLLAARPAPGYFTIYATAVPGPVVGTRVVYYQLG